MNVPIEEWRNGRIVVFGDVMLDRYWTGPTRRISPEAPVPVVRVSEETERAGGAANVAANAVSLGAKVDLIGGVGADAAGEKLSALCRGAGIEADFVIDANSETTVKLRVMSQHQQLLRLDFETERETPDRSTVERKFSAHLEDADAVVFSDYGKGFVDDSGFLIALARKAGKQVIVDPKSSDFSRYAGATLVTPNYAEFEACVGHCDDERDIVEKGTELCRQANIGALLVTRGELGMMLISASLGHLNLRAEAREVFDVTGAGDTVCAVIATALAAGADLRDAVAYANVAAGLVVAKSGTATVGAEELRRAFNKSGDPQAGAISLEALLAQLASARDRGESIVMTNGCFDILHAGHVAYLEQAKSLGDRLIVALNSDASVARLKGENRPIHRLEDRLRVIAALSAVDWVISFDEDDPLRLIQALCPDILVKGGDYQRADIVGSEFVLARGGEVHALPFVNGLSTTAIVDQLNAGAGRKAPQA